jgi:amino acid transporter
VSTQAKGVLGARNLTTVHAVGQALAIGPMFSFALIEGGISRPQFGAGWNATLAIVVASLGVLAIGYVIALFAREFAGAGAMYEYIARGAHPSVGIFASGVSFMGTLFLGGGGIFLGLGILMNAFWTAHISATGAPAWWVFGLIAIAFVLVLNYLGVRIAIRAMLAFAGLALVPMVALGIVIIAKGGDGGNTLTMFDPGQTSLFGFANGGVFGGVSASRRRRRSPRSRTTRAARSRGRCCGRSARRRCSSRSWAMRSRSATARRPSRRGRGRSIRQPSTRWRLDTSGRGWRRSSISS